jgi:cyclic-di-GMP-binding protein
MSFKFSVPTADSQQNTAVSMRPKQAKSWVDSLPADNAVEAARGIYTALYGSNRSKFDADERLKLLEIYHPRLINVLADLGKEYNQASLPLPEAAREAANLSRDLLIEYAYGYKLILLEKSTKLSLFTSKRQLPLMLYRAISALSDTLSLSYKTYTPTPAGVWHEIHQIYHYAQFHAMQDQAVEDEGAAAQTTISVVYKQALLLALADPYRLMPGEVDRVAAIVAHFSGGAIIMPYSPDLTGAGLALIQSDSDRPPKPLTMIGNIAIAPIDKVVSTANLAFTLNELIAQLDAGTPAKTLGLPFSGNNAQVADLLRRLARAWSSPPKRVFNRQRSEAAAEVCAGIHQLNLSLMRLQDPAWAKERVEQLAASANGAGAAGNSRIGRCEILNQSATGFALKKTPDGDPLVAVGEVLGVKLPDQGSWNVGAARWVQTNDAQEIEIGVQLLAPTAIAVMLEPLSGPLTKKHEALMLPPLEALKQPAYVLAPRETYKEGMEYKLEHRETIERVRATRLIEQTTHYDLFAFAPA